jgi:hypothetical protein
MNYLEISLRALFLELDVEELMRRQKAGRSKSMIGVSPLDRLKEGEIIQRDKAI